MERKSIFGLGENIAGMLCYALCYFSGIVILVLEKENKFVRFHALQSTIWFIILAVLTWGLRLVVSVLSGIPFFGWVIGLAFSPFLWLFGALTFVSVLFLGFMAFRGQTYKLPIIGEVVWAQVNR